MSIVARVQSAVQRILTEEAERVGAACGVIRRKREFTASTLAQMVVWGFLQNARASWDALAEAAAICGVFVSPQAVQQRFNDRLATFLQQLCEAMSSQAVSASPVLVELLQRFNGVYLHDSTSLALPDKYAEQWPGCGGNSSVAGLKLQVRFELLTGALSALRFEPGRDPDQKTPLQRVGFPRGALRIADLGYFCLKTLRFLYDEGVSFISRIQAGTALFTVAGAPLELLARLREDLGEEPVEMEILLGQEARLPCRLIAMKVPAEVAARRRRRLHAEARKKGRTPSERRLEWCEWTVYVTNVEAERLHWKELVVLYRARWQIELLFKLWKSHGLLAELARGPAECQMATLWARLLTILVQHWLLLASVWQLAQRSLTKALRTLRTFAHAFAANLTNAWQFRHLLDILRNSLQRTAKTNPRRRNPNHHQLLQNPDLLEYRLTSCVWGE